MTYSVIDNTNVIPLPREDDGLSPKEILDNLEPDKIDKMVVVFTSTEGHLGVVTTAIPMAEAYVLLAQVQRDMLRWQTGDDD